MPIYRISCVQCSKEEEVYRSIKDMDDLPSCHGQKMQRVICAPAVHADIQPYKSMVTGEMITSRSQHRAHLKQHNLMEIGNEVDAHMKQAGKPLKTKKKSDARKRLIAEKLESVL